MFIAHSVADALASGYALAKPPLTRMGISIGMAPDYKALDKSLGPT
jgi:hypothetical protein